MCEQETLRQRLPYANFDVAAHSARALPLFSADKAYRGQDKAVWAGVAQLVEHLICNQRVGGSSPFASSSSLSKETDFGCTAARSGRAGLRRFFSRYDRSLDFAELMRERGWFLMDRRPAAGKLRSDRQQSAQVAEWLMAADCKSAALCATEVRILPCAPLSLVGELKDW